MKNYEDEVIDIKGNVVLSIFIILGWFALFVTYNQYKNGDFGLRILLIVGVILVAFILVISFMCIANIINALKNQKIAKEIINKGIKVPGVIVDTPIFYENDYKNSIFKRASYFRKFRVIRLDEERKFSLYYFAIVKYEYNGQNYTVKTPSLNFYPEYLADSSVDVFIHNGKCYVDNFKINDTKLSKDKNDRVKMKVTVILLFFIMLILSAIAGYLLYKGKITDEEFFNILKCCGFLYVIIGIITYLKYFLKK